MMISIPVQQKRIIGQKKYNLEIRVMGIGTLSFIVALSIKVCILQ